MTNTNVFQLSQPGAFADPLTEGAPATAHERCWRRRSRSRSRSIAQRACYNLTENGHHRLVRHGHLPEREIMTGIGPVAVRCPRVRDRVGEGSKRIRFSLAISAAQRAPVKEHRGA